MTPTRPNRQNQIAQLGCASVPAYHLFWSILFAEGGFGKQVLKADSKQILARWGGAEGNMAVATFANKTKPLAEGSAFFAHTALRECRQTHQKARGVRSEIRLFGHPPLSARRNRVMLHAHTNGRRAYGHFRNNYFPKASSWNEVR